MSVENINPYNKYQGNGVATEFSVDFPYNNKTDVVVYLKNEGEAQQTLVVNTDYTWLNDTTIKTTTAPADGSILAIYRETPAASDYNFENQRRLFPAEVTNSDNLAILLIQELKAMFSRTLTVDETSTVTPEELVNELNSLVTTAAGYVSQCSGYSDLAQAWATKTDGPVSGGEYSSKYYAEQILPMASDIIAVAGNATNINKVANDINRVGLVADDISSVHTVAIDISNVIDVAANISDINTAAANITDIQNASANALLAKNWAIKMDGAVEGSDYSAKYNAGLARVAAEQAQEASMNAKTDMPFLHHFWSEYILEEQNFLRADTFSWHSGTAYKEVFKHLAKDMVMDRSYIIPVGGLNTKFFRKPSDDTETQFAWTQGFSILYTDREFPEAGDPIYYIGQVVDDVDEFAFSSSAYIITSLNADNKYYREEDEDDSVNGYYAWMFNSSTLAYTTSATPSASDTIYTKSGGTYTSAGTISSVLLEPTASTETIGGYTITYYTAQDGHKIVLDDQETTASNIYTAVGLAWYYIFDAANIRFKLPRENPIKELYQATGNLRSGRTNKYISYGIGVNGSNIAFGMSDTDNHFYIQAENGTHSNQYVEGSGTYPQSRSGMYADLTDGTTYNRGRNYLYFNVGKPTQTATEQTAGLNSELFNNKADVDLNNISVKIGRYTDLGSFTVARNGEITFSESLSNFDYIVAKGDYYIMQGRNNGNNVSLSGFFSGLDIANNVYFSQVYNVTLQYISGTKYKVATHSWADLYGTTMTASEISRSVRFYGIKIS